jgi:hypothetical protein
MREFFMITDKEVVQIFQKIPITPLPFTEEEQKGRKRQIFRGVSGRLWKDAHPAGCTRHLAVFRETKVIPEFCFDCYKVLITPRTVVELFKLLMVFEKIVFPADNTRKCMAECRNDCSGTYKGFVYCRGREEGNEVLKIVRKAVSEEISPQVHVSLKRGCSEYAQLYPRYAQIKQRSGVMQYKNEWKIHEVAFDKKYEFTLGISLSDLGGGGIKDTSDAAEAERIEGLFAYSRWEIFCMQFWLSYAATIGDSSYLAITAMRLPPIPGLKRPSFKASNIQG